MPDSVVAKGILDHADAFQTGQKFKQGIRRARRNNLVSRVAEEFEEVRVSLARRRREQNAGGWNFLIIIRHCLTGREESAGLGVVAQGKGIAK